MHAEAVCFDSSWMGGGLHPVRGSAGSVAEATKSFFTTSGGLAWSQSSAESKTYPHSPYDPAEGFTIETW